MTTIRPLDPALGVLGHPWARFIARRLLRFVASLWALVTVAFLLIHLIPGDPVRAALGLTAPAELVEARREALGLNDPLPVQYVDYLLGVLTGDLGRSMTTNLPVAQAVADRLPASVLLAVLAFAVVMLIAIPLGTVMAVLTRGGRRHGLEISFTATTVILSSIPSFLLAVGLVWLFAVQLGWLPIAGRTGADSYILPVLALALGSAATMTRLLRVELLSVLGNDYVRTARAKRLPSRIVYLRHALPNALTTTLTLGGILLTGLVAGTVLVESVFGWPGLGSTMVQGILSKDYPTVQGTVLVFGAMVLFVNLLVDLLLAVLDPRSTIKEG